MAKIDIVLEKVHEIREDQIQTNTDVKWIKKALEGNGKQGLIEETHNNSKFRHMITGGLKLLAITIGSGGLITLLITLIL